MSQLNEPFFARLAQKLPGFKSQVAKAAQARKACRNGTCGPPKPICGVCGAQFGIKTALVLGAPIPKFCPTCQDALDDGCTAFVTLEKPARFWIGKGTKPELSGKMAVVSKDQMDAIERAAANIPKTDGTSTGTELPATEA